MDKKYYTPTIEEFHRGFEFEVEETYWHNRGLHKKTGNWNQKTLIPPIMPMESIEKLLEVESIRVKFLDQEDIEELGWKNSLGDRLDTPFNTNEVFYLDVIKNNERVATFQLHKFDDIIIIDSYNETGRQMPSFQGWVKNKSELKKLMSQLGIQP